MFERAWMKEGYIKFFSVWVKTPPFRFKEFKQLNRLRNQLHKLGLVGVLKNGIGYGNLSVRVPGTKHFVITGTQTGAISQLKAKHYTRVTAYDIGRNTVLCEGPREASSEAMTHAACYEADSKIRAVVHVHHLGFWKFLKSKKCPTSPRSAAYGTPQMAQAIQKLIKSPPARKKKVIVMGGHEEGLLVFASSIPEAGKILIKFYNSFVFQKKVQAYNAV